jgi:Prokaryotic phospholipase A2
MASMLDVHRPSRYRVLRVVLLILAVGFLLSWATTPSASQPIDQPATPANEAADAHPWGTAGCVLPGAALDAVPGVFDFQHACIHHGGCYQGLDRGGEPAVIDRLRCDMLFRGDLIASCAVVHGASTNWRAKECQSTAEAYYGVARSFGAPYYTGSGNPA